LVESDTEDKMAVQAVFNFGVLTVHSDNAAPETSRTFQINFPSQSGPGDEGRPEESIAFDYGKLGSENADSVTGAGDPSAPMDSANNLKQIALAIHALDAGECSVDICAQNSPPASPEPVTYTGWGHFEIVLDGHIDANLVFDSTGGGRSTVLLPYIEQHGGEADDGGFVIDWTTGDGPKGGDTVGVIAIITPTEHGGSALEFSFENFPNNSQSGPGNERLVGFCATGQTSGDGSDQGIIIDWTSGDGSSHDAFPTETIFPTETVHPIESVHALCDLVL
jgi:hypothetical protein